MIFESLKMGYSVVVDATNFKPDKLVLVPANVEKYMRMFGNREVTILTTWQSFKDVPVETCIERDSKRGINMVGEKVIRDMYNRYLKPPDDNCS